MMRWFTLVVVSAVLIVEASPSVASTAGSTSRPSYKVLVLGPIASRSLYHLTKSVSEALGDAGHSATLITTFDPSSKHPNVTEVHTGASRELLDINGFKMQDMASIFQWHSALMRGTGRAMWQNRNILNLWEKRREFDAIIIIGYGNEIALPFLIDYEGPYIDLCTPGIEFQIVSRLGNFLPLSVTPSIILPMTEEMTFYERLINPWVELIKYLQYLYIPLPVAEEVLREFFPDMPPILELYESSHLTLINGHFALDGPMPLLPTQVEIGTINAKLPEPLPKDLEEFVESSGDEGIVYFSIGSIIKAKDIPQKYKMMLVEAFSRIPQKVIWKYEGNDLDLPPNVITRKWLPQQDILGHPKTRIFISHCGNLGTQEAKFHGVPILAVPVFFDQHRNAGRMVKKGFGLLLNWDDMTTESIVEAINKLLQNPAYAAKMKEVSVALKDQKESPKERAVWWVEYAIRHHKRNGSHMEYAGRKLHFLQYVGADVAAFWSVVFFFLTVVSYRLCLKLCSYCYHDKKSKNKRKQD